MRTGDAEVGQQKRRCFRLHRAAAIGMQGELAERDAVLLDRIVEQRLEQGSGFRIAPSGLNLRLLLRSLLIWAESDRSEDKIVGHDFLAQSLQSATPAKVIG